MTEDIKAKSITTGKQRSKVILMWIIIAIFVSYVGFIAWWFTSAGIDEEIWQIIIDQWLAMVLFPSACLSLLMVVLVLEHTAGNIEFKALGFEFKGASGQIVLWGMLVIITALCLKLLWE